MANDLSALIARLEAAEVGSRELDEAISDALCVRKTRSCIAGLSDEQGGMWMYGFDGHAPSSALRVTTSLDAALALAERLVERRLWNLWKSSSGYVASFEGDAYSRSSTPALALCIAILRAKQGEG